jgi:hypothetical protein
MGSQMNPVGHQNQDKVASGNSCLLTPQAGPAS